jgi:nitrite reductase (cytochrome c-552)
MSQSDLPATPDQPSPPPRPRRKWTFAALLIAVALATALVAGLLVSIFTRRQEAKTPFIRLVEVTEITTDPAEWGKNFPRHYDGYLQTADQTRTRYGGSEAMPQQKLDRDPWLRRMYAGYAFSIDFRDRRGHAYMLYDQEQTERITKKPQPGACLHCHASIVPTWRRVGLEAAGKKLSDLPPFEFDWPSVMSGFEKLGAMKYADAHAELLKTPDGTPNEERSSSRDPRGSASTTQQALASNKGDAHPVSCIDCHDPRSMRLRVTRPGFVNGIRALAQSNDPTPHLPSIERWRNGSRRQPYDPNTDATRQEMRSFVCGQCHVEYYCGPKVTLFFPWGKGLRAEQIEEHYNQYKFPDGHRFFDWAHGETGAELLKAQHPEFEVWSQGTHARAGVACADCHMPYVREGAMKVSDHHVRSPLLMVNRSCQVCHPDEEDQLKARVATIQDRTHQLIDRSSKSLVDMLDAIKGARQAGVNAQQLAPVFELQRKAQWRLDFIASENSMGFHAAQETARVLAESIDYSRQAVAAAQALHLTVPSNPANVPATQPIEGVTPADKAPPAPYRPLSQPEPGGQGGQPK